MKVEDLKDSKELSREEMSKVAGGNATPANPLLDVMSVFAPTNDYGVQVSQAAAFTGEQANMTVQGDNDVIVGDAGSQALNLGGNSASSANVAGVTSVSAPTLVQG